MSGVVRRFRYEGPHEEAGTEIDCFFNTKKTKRHEEHEGKPEPRL